MQLRCNTQVESSDENKSLHELLNGQKPKQGTSCFTINDEMLQSFYSEARLNARLSIK